MQNQETTQIVVQIDQIKNLIKEVCNHNTIISSYKDKIKDIRDEAKVLGVEPKTFNALVRMYAKDEREKTEEDFSEVIDLYDSIFKGTHEE